MNITIYVTSAFSLRNAGGNKAGIVFDHPEVDAICRNFAPLYGIEK